MADMVVTSRGAAAGEGGSLSDVFASEAAFDAWYETALPRVYGYVFSRCGRDPDLAEDLTQQAFIDAVRGRDTFGGRSDPVTWVCSIARHKLADHFRRLDDEEHRRMQLVARARTSDPVAEADAVEEREAIAAALGTLPGLQRAVLVFVALDGLTVREAAGLLHHTESATESLLHRARAGFRRAYGMEGDGTDG